MNFEHDTGSHALPLGTSAYGVEALGVAIEDVGLGNGAGRKERAIRKELVRTVDALADAAGWERQEFLEHAGCSSQTKLDSLELDFLKACRAYLRWVGRMVWALDLPVDRRTAVSDAAGLWREAEHDLKRCEEVIGRKGLSSTDLLQLGEVTYAFQIALAHLDTPKGRRARRVLLEDPDYASSPHVSSERVALARFEPEALGENVAAVVRRHMKDCEICTAIHGEFVDPRRAGKAE
jgi:hypothetical protein